MTEFSFETDLDVRFRDIDALGHVNNAVYATYLEEGRVRYLKEVLDLTIAELHFVVARLEIDYRRPISSADRVTVAVGVTSLGTTSFEFTYELRAEGAVVATGTTTQVVVDADAGTPTEIPTDWRRRFAEFEGFDEA
ncbi:MAG: acyl-CoA thioesterase [Halobacteriota archaeon]